jgi:transcription initiation factor TFIIB
LRILENNCTSCGSDYIINDYDSGEEVCGNCGLVLKSKIVSLGPEWRAFSISEQNSRKRTGIGLTNTLFDRGMSTVFKGDRDASGRKLDDKTRVMMFRLRKYDNRSKFNETWRRNLSIAMAELDRMSTKLHIPQNVKEQAATIYRKALKKDLIRGRSIDAFVAASIYAACRFKQVPRPLKEITKASLRQHSEISRTYRMLLKELDLKMPIDTPMKFIPSIASKLNIQRHTEQRAIQILTEASKRRGLTGKDPRGLAAAALYMACNQSGERKIQKDIAIAAGTTEVTLRNRLRGIEAVLNS